MKNALNNQVGMLGNMFSWLVANLKQGVNYFIKQACGNDILASVYNYCDSKILHILVHFEVQIFGVRKRCFLSFSDIPNCFQLRREGIVKR